MIFNLFNLIYVNSFDVLFGIKRIYNNIVVKIVGIEISVSLFIWINLYKFIEVSVYIKIVKGMLLYIMMGMNSVVVIILVIIFCFIIKFFFFICFWICVFYVES